MSKATADARDQMLVDMKAVIDDAEELLKATAGAAGDRIGAARTRAEETLRTARRKLAEGNDAMLDDAKQAAKAADDYVHENPWAAVGVAGVVGLLVGIMISRR